MFIIHTQANKLYVENAMSSSIFEHFNISFYHIKFGILFIIEHMILNVSNNVST